MIKQSIYSVVLASLALTTSCSQDEASDSYVPSNTSIKVNTSFKTRAVETTISNLGSFRVSAFQEGQSNYMSAVKYTSTDGSTWGTADGTFYWPVEGDLHMYGYAPDQPGQQGTYKLDKDAQTLTGFVPNTAAADQKDFVYAKSTGSVKQNGSTGVDIDFQHALSEITIAAKNSNTAYKVEVTGVKIGNVITKGTFTFPSITNAPAKWTLSTDAADVSSYTTTWNAPFTLGDDVKTMDAANVPFMILPQQLVKSDKASEKAYIAMNVKITMQGGLVKQNGWVYVGIDTNWEMGKRYAYTLDFTTGAGQDENGKAVVSGSSINLNVAVKPWEAKTGEADTEVPYLESTSNANSVVMSSAKNWYGIDITRANTFWSSADGDASNVIGDATEWTAEVIWQDIPSRAINFCDASGKTVSGDTYSGVGKTPLYVKAAGTAKGNVVLGIKKKGSTDYLWSWHLWLTDKPQNCK